MKLVPGAEVNEGNIVLSDIILDSIWCVRNLVPFVQFKKREKQPWRNVTFSKLYKWYQIAQSITYEVICDTGFCRI